MLTPGDAAQIQMAQQMQEFMQMQMQFMQMMASNPGRPQSQNGPPPQLPPLPQGLPGRYRPVSHHPAAENKSRANTMSGALENWTEAKQGSATVKAVKKSGNTSDEDDEEGWEAMKQKRDKKKSIWRSKKDDGNGLKDLLGFANI
jgi:hypothetical protein